MFHQCSTMHELLCIHSFVQIHVCLLSLSSIPLSVLQLPWHWTLNWTLSAIFCCWRSWLERLNFSRTTLHTTSHRKTGIGLWSCSVCWWERVIYHNRSVCLDQFKKKKSCKQCHVPPKQWFAKLNSETHLLFVILCSSCMQQQTSLPLTCIQATWLRLLGWYGLLVVGPYRLEYLSEQVRKPLWLSHSGKLGMQNEVWGQVTDWEW